MTIAAGSPDLPGVPDTGRRYEIGRWTISIAIVLALHLAVALVLISRPMGLEPPAAPPAAVLIDLAPPAPPPAPAPPSPPEPPPPPQAMQPPLPPPPPIPDEPPAPPPPLPPPPKAVVLPKPPPPLPKPPKPRPVVEQPPPQPAPPVVQPPPRPAPSPPPVAAPAGPPPAAIAAARANWSSQLSAALQRSKRYPRAAQEQRQQGTAALSFVVDRNGRVLSASIARSSGFPLLDEEVLALVQRAQPLPPAPAEVAGNQFPMTVPISFTIGR